MSRKYIDDLNMVSTVWCRENYAETVEKAIRCPVLITRRKRPVCVMIFHEDYERLKRIEAEYAQVWEHQNGG